MGTCKVIFLAINQIYLEKFRFLSNAKIYFLIKLYFQMRAMPLLKLIFLFSKKERHNQLLN